MPTPPQPLNILICRLSAHGDVIQTLPLLTTLKAVLPDCRIGWLVESSAAPLLAQHCLIDQLHVCPLKQWRQQLKQPRYWMRTGKDIQAFIHTLKTAGYDTSLDVQGLLKSAIWPWLARIPMRVGFNKTREQAAFFYNHRLPPHDLKNPDIQMVRLFASFASALTDLPLPAPRYELSPPQPQVQAWLASLKRPWLVLAPGTVWPSKQWPHWPDFLGSLQTRYPEQTVLLVGGPNDVDKINGWLACTGMPLPLSWRNLVGQTDWPALQAVLSQADFLIGPDSVAMHLADAAGKAKILALFGPTSPGRTGPLGEGHQVLATRLTCQPCFKRHCPIQTHDCLTQISVDQVLSQVMMWLSAWRE